MLILRGGKGAYFIFKDVGKIEALITERKVRAAFGFTVKVSGIFQLG